MKINRWIAILFILCGLIIGLAGSYGNLASRHYIGEMAIDDERVVILEEMYPAPDNTAREESVGKFFYNFYHYSPIGLDMDLNFRKDASFPLWVSITFGCGYILLGILGLKKYGNSKR